MNVKAWLINTINVKAQTGITTAGDPVLGSATPIKCRQENSKKVIKDRDGNERQSNYQVVTDVEIAATSIIWLSGETVATDTGHNIIRIDSAATKRGTTRLWHVYL